MKEVETKERWGVRGWSRNEDQGQPERLRARGGGGFTSPGGQRQGETALIQATAQLTYILHSHALYLQRLGSIDNIRWVLSAVITFVHMMAKFKVICFSCH